MADRFELEEKILICWGIMEDLQLVYRMTDRDNPDEICNALLGLSTLYEMKFQDLWHCFETMVEERKFAHENTQDNNLSN